MRGKAIVGAGLAALLGAAIAFPAGMMFAGSEASREPRREPAAGAAMPNFYSPKVLDDPYFVEQQRRNVEALEQQCRESGKMCYEAREARRWLDGHSVE